VDRGRKIVNSIKDNTYKNQYSVRECVCDVLGTKYIYAYATCQPIKRDTVRWTMILYLTVLHALCYSRRCFFGIWFHTLSNR